MNHLSSETEDSFASLLDLAASNDVEGFKRSIERDPSCVNKVGLWTWCRCQKGSKQMANQIRTPLMVAASYGSIDVIKLILSLSNHDINRACGHDKSTALHCAASSGAINAVEVVKLLLESGADPNSVDENGHRPVDVIVTPRKFVHVRNSLEELLQIGDTIAGFNKVISASSNSCSRPLSPSPENRSAAPDFQLKSKLDDVPVSSAPEMKKHPVDPYSTDEFRMYSFKVHTCSRDHNWSECPFVHRGEKVRRRDPRKYHYSYAICSDFREGACRRGEKCEYAHGAYESGLHPARYRTRLCKDGTSCSRRVCFSAHTNEELRPLNVSTGSGIPSPRSSTCAQPMPPSANAWHQPNVPPALHVSGSNLHSSRLRSSFNARDIPTLDFDLVPDYDDQQPLLLDELSRLSQLDMSSDYLNHFGRLKELMIPSNLDDDLESSSPRSSDSPVNTNFSPKNVETPLAVQTTGRMSPRNMEPISPMSPRISMLAQRENQQQHGSLSFREPGSNSSIAAAGGSPVDSLSKLGSSSGAMDRPASADESGKPPSGNKRSQVFRKR